MLNALYLIIIYPLERIVEFSYRVFFNVFGNTGISIIGVSIAITLLCLPLYAVAEKWQETERNIEKKLKPGIDRIKKTFKGDEQYMILSAFYKENHYHPLMALRSSFGLLIQIPFFIAAYNYLSHTPEISGGWLFIKDLSKPDSLFKIGNFGVNVLPVAMTLINCVSGAIYSKGHGLREKIQIYGMAAVFLVILYNSPAGLVLYWTMNNVFSLVKNIFYKMRNPLKVFYIMCSAVFTAAVIFLAAKKFEHLTILVLCDLILIFIPLIIKAAKKIYQKPLAPYITNFKMSTSLFVKMCISLAVLCGIVIPSFLMTSSTAEYCYLEGNSNPLYFLYNSFVQAAGLFIFWPLCLYFLFGKKTKAVFAYLFLTVLVLGLANNFLFPGNYGNILPEVVFTEHRTFFPTKPEFFANVAFLSVLFLAVYALFFFKMQRTISVVSSILLMTCVAIALVNVVKIGSFFSKYDKPEPQLSETDKIINLSKTGKNVIVIMMDRSTGYIIDPVFEANQKLYEQFDGFVKYPNTVSFGSWTIQGAVCLYGGYEYTPWEMNHRRELPMVEKHNEGISLQANIFSQNGYKCTVMDPPYPNYDKPPEFKAFESLEDVSAYKTIGKYREIWYKEHGITPAPIRTRLIKRNFLYFSLFKIAPMILRPVIHYQEFWGGPKNMNGEDLSHFVDNYSVLDYLPRLTKTDNEKDCFVIMDNELTHDQVFTQLPDYTPAQKIDNSERDMSGWNSNSEFHVNMAGYKMLGKYFDFLRENGVYDNSRIIIVADHGANTRMKDKFGSSPTVFPLEKFNPVLMVKDFNSHGKMKDDLRYMTHADVPALAMENVIQNPVNPYTGKEIRPLTTEEKNEHSIISMSGANAVNSTVNNGYRIKDSDWYKVHDSIFESSNWTKLNVKNGELTK